MSEFFSFTAIVFTTFFPMVDPLGAMPIFTSITHGLNTKQTKIVASKASLMALSTILLFGFFGHQIFQLFGISASGLKIVGGVIFFVMGYDMLNAKFTSVKSDGEETSTDSEIDVAITPLGIPLLCGPGAMTNATLQMDKASSHNMVFGFVTGVLLIIGFTWICLAGASRISRFLGQAGNAVILRIMGLLLMVIAVESFFSGLTPIVREILYLKEASP